MTQKQDIFTLLGGRVKFHRGRYNPTSDAVWLAAWAADTHAKTVLDVGIGTGGAALCLMSHMPDAVITGLDISPEMLAECKNNAALNNKNIEFINADIITWRTGRTFDLVITNPPYFRGTPAKHNAHHNADLTAWTNRCLARVRPQGTFVIIVDAAASAQIIATMAQKCGNIEVFPLYGAKRTAERVIIRGKLGTHGSAVLHQGMSMNTEAVLRDGLTIASALATLD